MKFWISVLPLVVLLFVAGVSPAAATTVLFDNGPYNGTVDAWTINGYVVSNGFTTSGGTATGANFVLWVPMGSSLTSVDWAFGSVPGGTQYASGTASPILVSYLGIYNGEFGKYSYMSYGISFPDLALAAGTTYWFSLYNAVDPRQNGIFWDQNDGPAMAWESDLGYLAGSGYACSGACSYSEAFQITGAGGSPIPEPDSFALMGLGLVGVAGLLRRRVSR